MTIRQAILVLLIFVALTPVGTLLHETGHYISGVIQHCGPALHYNSVTIHNYIPAATAHRVFLIQSLSGPLVSLLIGTIGLLLVIASKNHRRLVLLYIPLSFFWARQVFNLAIELFSLLTARPHLHVSDEQSLSLRLDLPGYTFSLLLGIIGMVVLVFAITKVPAVARLKYIVFAASGCIIGYITWFRLLGPAILP